MPGVRSKAFQLCLIEFLPSFGEYGYVASMNSGKDGGWQREGFFAAQWDMFRDAVAVIPDKALSEWEEVLIRGARARVQRRLRHRGRGRRLHGRRRAGDGARCSTSGIHAPTHGTQPRASRGTGGACGWTSGKRGCSPGCSARRGGQH